MYMCRFVFLCLLSSIVCVSYAQRGDAVSWTDKYDEDGVYDILTVRDSALYIMRSDGYRLFSDNNDIEIIKFGMDLEVEYAVEVRDLEQSRYADIGTIATSEGILHLYYQTTKKKQQRISGQLFDYEDLRKTDIVDLALFKMKTGRSQRIDELSYIEYLLPIGYRLSQDKSKMVLYYHQEKVGKRKETYYQYKVLDLYDGFRVLQEGSFYSDDQSNRYEIDDFVVGNNGHLNYLLKHYTTNGKREFVNKKPAYAYELHHLTGDSTEYIYDIKVKNEFIDNLKIGSGDNGEVYIAGYLRDKPMDDIYGAYFLSLDPMGNVVSKEKDDYRPRDIEEMQGKKKKELNRDFQVEDVIVGDEMVYVIKRYTREERSTINNNPGMGGTFGGNRINGFTDVSWDLEEVVVEAYGKISGEQQWMVTNKRRQSDNEEYLQPFIKGSSHVVGDDLYFIYNERPINLERMRNREKLKRADVPGDHTDPTFAKITSDGEISYRSVIGEKRYYISDQSAFISPEGVFLVASRSNLSKCMIGRIDRSILE